MPTGGRPEEQRDDEAGEHGNPHHQQGRDQLGFGGHQKDDAQQYGCQGGCGFHEDGIVSPKDVRISKRTIWRLSHR